MANISTTLAQKLERDPAAKVSVIVRVQGDTSARAQQVQARGIAIKHAYTLIPGFALSGPAAAILALSKEPWVVSVEEDKPVHTM